MSANLFISTACSQNLIALFLRIETCRVNKCSQEEFEIVAQTEIFFASVQSDAASWLQRVLFVNFQFILKDNRWHDILILENIYIIGQVSC
jgi:hypothetical protein